MLLLNEIYIICSAFIIDRSKVGYDYKMGAQNVRVAHYYQMKLVAKIFMQQIKSIACCGLNGIGLAHTHTNK